MEQFNPAMKDSQMLRSALKPEVDVNEFIEAIRVITSTDRLMLELRNFASEEELALLEGRKVCVIDTQTYLDVMIPYIRDEFQQTLANWVFGVIAQVRMHDDIPYLSININNYKLQNKVSRLEVLNHEILHIQQIERGDLKMFEDSPIVEWKGIEYNITPPANESYEDYIERQLTLPWEIEAYYFYAPSCIRAFHGEKIIEAYNRTFK